MKRSTFALGAILSLILAIASCSTDGPTRGTPLSETTIARTGLSGGLPSGAGVSGAASTATFNTSSEQEADEQFNCTNVVQNVQARFSSPGFVNDNVVGFFVEFSGFPDVNRTLRIWWDEENAPESHEDVPLEDSDLWRIGDLMAFDKVVEHTYSDISQRTEFRVRVELSLADQTGNCARVRRVTVAPHPAVAPPDPCETFGLSRFSRPTMSTTPPLAPNSPDERHRPGPGRNGVRGVLRCALRPRDGRLRRTRLRPESRGLLRVRSSPLWLRGEGAEEPKARIWSICGSSTTYGRGAP